MLENMRVAVIIAAAGTGSRMGYGIPKQFLKIGGKTILQRTVEAFSLNASIDDVIIVADKDSISNYRDLFPSLGEVSSEWQKIIAFVPGGSTRQESVASGLSAVPVDAEIVLVHDGARPFVTDHCIDEVISLAAEHGAACAAVPIIDTVKTCENGVFTSTLDRSALYSVQTPQGFRKDIISRAYEAAFRDGFTGTDDAVLVERIGVSVFFAAGDYNNIKITVQDDIIKAEVIAGERDSGFAGTVGSGCVPPGPCNGDPETSTGERDSGLADSENRDIYEKSKMRIGTGYDAHRFCDDRPLILAGVHIPYKLGLLGHSDADVLVHAVMDALLGAAALGDIGKFFPDSDPRYKGISSMKLLEKVMNTLKISGWAPVNVDATIIAEEPKMAGFIEKMRVNLAKALILDISAVSVKATTTEGMGFTGRSEGIAAQACVLLTRLGE